MQFTVNSMTVELVQGDITTLETDAITNAANSSLILGSGVAGAIRRRGGPTIQEECNRIGHCDVGNAVITTGGDLPAKYVIHAVGPRMGEGEEREKLYKATLATLNLAEKHSLSSVALPAISTGVFGFPMMECAQIMARAIIRFSFSSREHLHDVVVCLFGNAAYKTFCDVFMEELSDVDDSSKDSTLVFGPKDI